MTILEQIKAGTFVGRVDDLPAEAYHAAPYLSNSAQIQFAESPAHYIAAKTAERRREVIGTGTHMAVLEPARFAASLVVIQDRRGNRGKEADEAAAAGKFVVTEKEHEQIRRQADAILADPWCKRILSKGKPEVSLFWIDAETGVHRKARLDWLRDDGMVADRKYFNTVTNIREIERQCHRMKYHWQAGTYLDGVEAVLGIPTNEFIHIFVTDSEPFVARPIILGDASLEKARIEYRPLLSKFKECEEKNQWPAYEVPETGVTTIELPSYAW
jgi:hypothetical protein